MSETRQWVERFEALRDDLATGDLYHVQKWVQNDGALTEIAEGIARLARELEEARARLEQYQRLVVFADSVARARGDACGLCDALGRDDQPYQSHRAADLIAEAERALIARRGKGGGE